MHRRKTLTIDEAAGLVELVANACEAHRDWADRLLFMYRGINAMLGTRVAMSLHWKTFGAPGGLPAVAPLLSGDLDASEQAAAGYYFTQPSESDPSLANVRARFNALRDGRPLTLVLSRDELVSRRAWYTSDHVRDVRRPSGVDQFIYAFHDPGAQHGDRVFGFSCHRGWRERAFTPRELALIEAFFRGVRPLMMSPPPAPTPPAPAPVPPAPRPDHPDLQALTPRLRSVLDRLLLGESAKDAARALGLSVASVQTYTRVLYRQLGVHSRGELIVRLTRSGAIT